MFFCDGFVICKHLGFSPADDRLDRVAWIVSADRYGFVVVTPQFDNVAYKGHEFEKMGAAAAALAFAPN